MANRPEEKRRQAFLDDIRAVEKKHGLKLAVDQPPPQIVIVHIDDEPTEKAN